MRRRIFNSPYPTFFMIHGDRPASHRGCVYPPNPEGDGGLQYTDFLPRRHSRFFGAKGFHWVLLDRIGYTDESHSTVVKKDICPLACK